MSSYLVLLSGGLDSTTALVHTLHRMDCDEARALIFNYGQRHKREITHAIDIASRLGVPYNVADISPLLWLFPGNALTDSSVRVPEGHYAAENMKLTVVPNRNAIFLSIAFGVASANGIDFVVIGAHSGDHPIYPDCRPEFMKAFDLMEGVALDGMRRPYLLTPFIQWDKSRIVRCGAEHGAPYQLTWSCYKGGILHCGRCGTCVERKEAFRLAGVEDPTEYEDGSEA